MPSPLETLVKILKLEREQGCENKAVMGGLGEFSAKWKPDALASARKPEHSLLVDELVDLLQTYESISNKTERHKSIGYMLDRITGRIPMPDEYKQRLATVQVEARESRQAEVKPSPDKESQNQQVEQPKPQQKQPASNNRPIKRSSNRTSRRPQKLDIKPLPKLDRAPRKSRPERTVEESLQLMDELDQSITVIKGIGEKVAEPYANVGIKTIRDMLNYFPRRYDDYTSLTAIRNLIPNATVTVIGMVRNAQIRIGRNARKDFAIVLDDGTEEMEITFFGQHFLTRSIKVDQQIVVSGKVTRFRDKLQMVNPEWEHLDAEQLHTARIVPVYPMSDGLKPRSFRNRMKQVVDDWTEKIVDYVPEATLERAELGDLGWAIRNIHFPEGWDHLEHAQRRLTFDELILLQLAILGNRREWQAVPGPELQVTDDFVERFVNTVFPYELTNAQQRAIADTRRDVQSNIPMNRLIQGDVGSGKTAVATVALAIAIQNGKQAALMAPTSILAEQHYRGIRETLAKMDTDQNQLLLC